MDPELETLFSDWEILEKENMVHQEIKKNMAIHLVLIFLQFIVYYIRIIVDYLNNEKKKIDKQYYSVDELD